MIKQHRRLPHKKILEGMREGDLNDLLLPIISVDEYESKIDAEKAIVLGFYVHDVDAAKDLNRFLQKSAIEILDIDVSPAPDQHGYFLVFVELLKNDTLYDKTEKLLKEVEPLVSISKWKMRVRKNKGLLLFSKEKMKRALKIADVSVQENAILEFMKNSNLDQVVINENILSFIGGRSHRDYEVVEFDEVKNIQESLFDKPQNVSLTEAFSAVRLESLLGSQEWIVSNTSKNFILTRYDSDLCLVIKPI